MSRSLMHALVVVVTAGCVALGFSVAWSSLTGATSPVPYATKADFDQAFADAAAGHRDFKPADIEKLQNAGRKLAVAR